MLAMLKISFLKIHASVEKKLLTIILHLYYCFGLSSYTLTVTLVCKA